MSLRQVLEGCLAADAGVRQQAEAALSSAKRSPQALPQLGA